MSKSIRKYQIHKLQIRTPQRGLGALIDNSQNVTVPRKYALFFRRLSILERATDHECINNCNHPKKKEMWVGFKCNGLVIFSQRGGTSKYNTCVSRLPHPHLPPRLLHLISLVPSPLPPPPPKLRCCWAGHL